MATQPFYAIIMSIFYIGIVYILVKKENKYISYGLTILAVFLQITFIYFWYDKVTFLMNNTNLEFQAFESFYVFVNTFYFVLFLPLLLILAWYGIKKIIIQDHFLLLKMIFVLLYIAALIGLLLLGRLAFIILFYGFAP